MSALTDLLVCANSSRIPSFVNGVDCRTAWLLLAGAVIVAVVTTFLVGVMLWGVQK